MTTMTMFGAWVVSRNIAMGLGCVLTPGAGSGVIVGMIMLIRAGAVVRDVIVAPSRVITRRAVVDDSVAAVFMPMARARVGAGDVVVSLGRIIMPRAIVDDGMAAMIVTMTVIVGVAAWDIVVISDCVVVLRAVVPRDNGVTATSMVMLRMVMAVRPIAVTSDTFAIFGNALEEPLWSGSMLVSVVDNMASSGLLAGVVGGFSGSSMGTIMSSSVIMGRGVARNIWRHVVGSSVRRGGNFAGRVAHGSVDVPGLVFGCISSHLGRSIPYDDPRDVVSPVVSWALRAMRMSIPVFVEATPATPTVPTAIAIAGDLRDLVRCLIRGTAGTSVANITAGFVRSVVVARAMTIDIGANLPGGTLR